MKRALIIALLAALATVPATKPARADHNKHAAIVADPPVIALGERGRWIATRHGDWQGGTLSIYIVGKLAEVEYTPLYPDVQCTAYHTDRSYRLECTSAAEVDQIIVTGTLVLAPPELHSVVCADDQADTYLADNWQVVTGIRRLVVPMVLR